MEPRYRILLVHSSDETIHPLHHALSQHYEVTTATDARLAHQKLAFHQPDLALIHLKHDLQHLDLCIMLKKSAGTHTLPVIFLTDLEDTELARKVYAAGGNLLLRWPVDTERLIRNLELTLAQAGPPRQKKHAIDEPFVPAIPPAPPREHLTEKLDATPMPDDEPRDVFLERPLEKDKSTPRSFHTTIQDTNAPARPRVMIVDDDVDTVELIQMALQQDYEVLTAGDGLQAMERILVYEPDLIILDIMMPKMNGFQLCTSLRRNPDYREIPIVFLSAKSSKKDHDYAYHCGATAYINKPFDMHYLQAYLHQLVSNRAFQIRPKHFNFHEVHNRERDLLKKQEEMRQDRESRVDQQNISGLYRKSF